MVLTEKEVKVIGYLRNPYGVARTLTSPLNSLTNKEVVSLYDKMDEIIEEEGNFRRSSGSFDEMYIVELSSVKNLLSEEISKRGLNMIQKPHKKEQ